VEAGGQEGNENVRLNPILQSMMNRAQGQFVFEVFESRFPSPLS
jgi:hypothetical protein